MRSLMMALAKSLAVAGCAALLLAGGAAAHQHKTKSLIILHPWVHAATAGAASTEGYLTIRNTGHETERLLGAVIDGVGEAAVMQPVAGQPHGNCKLAKGIDIAPGATLELKPGLAGLKFGAVSKTLLESVYANGVLNFAKAGAVKIEFYVEAEDAKSSGHVELADCAALPATQ
jgi:periplasmic copper chaperone A